MMEGKEAREYIPRVKVPSLLYKAMNQSLSNQELSYTIDSTHCPVPKAIALSLTLSKEA